MTILQLFFLAFSVSAHLRMTSPEPLFQDPSNARAPVNICNLIPYIAGGSDTIQPFYDKIKSQFGTVRNYVDACAQSTQTQICGKTDKNRIVPVPQDGIIRIEKGADHIGPSEIWVDNTLVMSNVGISNGQVIKTPTETRVDFSKICKGTCTVRFVMAGIHQVQAEIFDNCVQISMSGQTGSAAPLNTPARQIRNGPVTTSTPPPVITQVASFVPAIAPAVQQKKQTPTCPPSKVTPSKEWSCSSDTLTLIRTVNQQVFYFKCPAGTKCTTKNVPYAMCNHA
jgi:hypothetical protein